MENEPLRFTGDVTDYFKQLVGLSRFELYKRVKIEVPALKI